MAIGIQWTGTDKEIFKRTMTKIFDTTQEPALEQWRDMFKAVSVSDLFSREGRMAGIGLPEEVSDGQGIQTQTPTWDDTLDYTQLKFGTGFRYTDGWKKFNRWDLAAKLTKNLGIVMREGKCIDCSSVYNSATGTDIVGFDGKALAATDHSCLDDASTTWDNYLNAALGVTSLATARLRFRKSVKDDGQRLVLKPDKLWVNPDLEYTANELTKSTGKVDSADNNINIHQGAFGTYVYDRLTSTTSWGLSAQKDPDFDIFVETSEEPRIWTMDAPDTTGDTLVLAQGRYVKGFRDARRVVVGDL